MHVIYLLPILQPQRPECEAISQEIETLRDHFDGDIVYINPNRSSPIYIPRLFFGIHKLRRLRALEKADGIYHIYNPDPFPFPILKILQPPVVYSLTGGVTGRHINISFFADMAAVTVADERSLKHLESQGLNNVFLAQPGINNARFTHTLTPLESEIRLMVGSAPWTKAQFKTKGVDALLEAAKQMPELRLIFLWRGVLVEEMVRRVRDRGLEAQVEILNERVDVNSILANAHASVTLAEEPDIVKAYPHSLLESLAAGKPVLVSRSIPMAEYVERTRCGVVLERVTPSDIRTTIRKLILGYDNLQRKAQEVGKQDFHKKNLITSYEKIYRAATR